MKLCRYGKPGYEKPGVIDGEGRLRDLSKVIDNVGPNEISPRQLKTLSKLKPETLPLVNSVRSYAFSDRVGNAQINPQFGLLLSRLWVQ